MSTLHEQILSDNAMFFSPADFGEQRVVNNKTVMAVEDSDQLLKYQSAGICEGQKLVYVPSNTFDKLPAAGDQLLYGWPTQQRWAVEQASEEMGITELILKRYR
ncbi:MAG: hypothetical protein VB035_06135 [Candidatus Fimivivens sp.]|nr:hypothetical protein [Candidatus Fimivivens sp.]